MATELLEQSEELARTNAQVARLCRDLEEKVRIQTAELDAVREELEYTRTQEKLKYRYDEIVSTSPAMQDVLQILDRVTETEVPVLIEGESGTGKELIARALHYNSPRASRPFQAINCAAVSESLLESELFGVERGAYTGADRDRKGLIELSDGGTLFLDEVGEMSLAMQAKLLRVLETGEVWPVGGKQKRTVHLRLVAATNRRLRELVEAGRFRGDLYYRLRGVSVVLPPLRERREDIPLLIDHFLQRYGSASGRRKTFTRGLVNLLCAHDWPGNVRELEQEVRSLLALGDEIIDAEHVSPHIRERQGSWL
jgi:transcriptional regulator with PAS, ATPase and Fis domain